MSESMQTAWAGFNWRRSLVWGLLAVLLALAGCAQKPQVMRFRMPMLNADQQIMWPAPPEPPRLVYVGDIVGEGNIDDAGGSARSGMVNLLEAIAGIHLDDEEPQTLVRPQNGVVDPNGRIYITDVGRAAVFVMDETQGTMQIWSEARPLTKFIAPTGIALGANGRVLVADADLREVVVLDADGQYLNSIGKGALVRPTGLVRDAERGLIYVADTVADEVKVFDDQGNLVKIIGNAGSGDGDLNAPVYLTLRNGELYVADTLNARIQVFDEEGNHLRTVGKRGLFIGNLTRPKGVAVDSDNNLYIIESYYDHLLIFNQAGELLLPIGGAGVEAGKFFLPAGVWIDDKDRVFVADMLNGRVSIFQYIGND